MRQRARISNLAYARPFNVATNVRRTYHRVMAFSPEYEAALDALSRAADAMSRACAEYNEALRAAAAEERSGPRIEALRKACEDAQAAHDEALADAWELIEEQE